MPTVTLNKKTFEDLVGKSLPLEELKDRISMIGTDLEKIEGNEIVVEVFPNRPDMLCEQGFARAFSSFIGVKTGFREYKVNSSNEKIIIDESVKDVRPFTACAIIKGLNLNNESIKQIIQIQEKLHVTYGRHRKKVAIGIYPLEKIKFPVTFTSKKPKDIKFQPLEMNDIIFANEILEKHSAGKEYGHLLKDKDKYPLFIDANNEVLSMPPIINSHNIGRVTEETKDVFIECSGFDFDILHKCLNMIVTSLADMGGEIYSLELEYNDNKKITPNLLPIEHNIDLNYINKKLGLELTEKEMIIHLEKMGHGYSNGKVLVPSYRVDIMHMIDFVEEIAISYGYENFDPVLPECATIGKESDFEIFKNKIITLLIGLNMIETNTYNIVNIDNQTKKMNHEIDFIKLKNALSEDYNALRFWMTPSIMEVYSNNKHNEYPQNIFGIGRIFLKDNSTETKVKEYDSLVVGLCSEETDFTKIKQILDYIMYNLGINYITKEQDYNSFIIGRSANIIIDNNEVGFLGEISPKVLENWDLIFPVSICEINLSKLYEIYKIFNKI
jgi:phenylalanyl-tRNA synthetase beta chain